MLYFSQFRGGGKRWQQQEFTATGAATWTRPTGVDVLYYLLVGAGGGGAPHHGAGGGGGQIKTGFAYVFGNVTVTIGAKGLGGVIGVYNPTSGGDSTLTSNISPTVTAEGGDSSEMGSPPLKGGDGGGGTVCPSTSSPGDSGIGSFGGANGGAGGAFDGTDGKAGGLCPGFTAGGTSGSGQGGGGGASFGKGGNGGNGSAGQAGSNYGGGGGGGDFNRSGGDGADGYCLLRWLA